MVRYYRRWRRWTRKPRWNRWRRRRPFYRRKYRWRRRQTVRRRRKQKRVATFWQPPNRIKCTITGWTLGANACTTPTRDITNRVYKTWIDPGTGNSQLVYEGGGVNCIIFSLQFLWEEYRMFHNVWSETNDGHDLARYFGTKFYLEPNRYCDYIFWWDRDFQHYTNESFIKCHPVNMLGWKNKVFVRSQVYGNNHKARKVFIKPPATQLNTWRHMQDWYMVPLFTWGITIIDWNKFFSSGKSFPYSPLPNIWYGDFKWSDGGMTWNQLNQAFYNSFYDTGEGNIIRMALRDQDSESPPGDTWKQVDWADGLPYWMSFFGQNKTYDMGMYTRKQLIANTKSGYYWIWFKIKYPLYKSWQESNTVISPENEKWIAWKFKYSVDMIDFTAPTIQHGLAYSGPFMLRDNTDFVQIPILYKSFWQWGGQTWSNQEIINPGHFTKSAVTIKNPATVARAVIHPWDTDASGLLTKQALERIIRPSSKVEERRREPGAKSPPYDERQPEWETETSEEDETDTEEESEEETEIRTLQRRLQREQYKRRKFFRVLRRLVKTPKGQTREGALPPPPQGAPPPQTMFE
nr:ORF1 [Torque teno felis virus]